MRRVVSFREIAADGLQKEKEKEGESFAIYVLKDEISCDSTARSRAITRTVCITSMAVKYRPVGMNITKNVNAPLRLARFSRRVAVRSRRTTAMITRSSLTYDRNYVES